MKHFLFCLTVGALFISLTGISRAAENAVTVNVLASPNPKTLSSILSYLEIAAKYPDQVKLNLQFVAVENQQNDKAWAQQTAQTLYAFEKFPQHFQEYADCLSMDWPNRVCSTTVGIEFSEFNKRENDSWLKGYESKIVAISMADIRKRQLPEVKINGEAYTGRNLLTDITSAINSKLPAGRRLPKMSEGFVIEVYAIGETTGMAARDLQWEASLAKLPYIKIVPLRASSSLAKKLMGDAEVKTLPAYLTLKEQNETTEFEVLAEKNVFAVDPRPKGMGAIFPPLGFSIKEVAGAKAKGDELDVYIMSQCPFGVKAQNAILKSLDKEGMPKKVNFKYIVNKDAKKNWQSLHGQAEVDENIRQLTIQKLYPEKYNAYVLERAKNYKDDNWTDAAIKVGLDIESIKTSLKHGELVLEQNMADVVRLNINASPTFVWQDKYILSGRKGLQAALGVDPYAEEAKKQR